jgi:hypothetical protein
MNAEVNKIVLNAHQKALKKGKDLYKTTFIHELLTGLESHFKLELTKKLQADFATGIWQTEERWSSYRGKRLTTGEFLKMVSSYSDFYFRKVKLGITR